MRSAPVLRTFCGGLVAELIELSCQWHPLGIAWNPRQLASRHYDGRHAEFITASTGLRLQGDKAGEPWAKKTKVAYTPTPTSSVVYCLAQGETRTREFLLVHTLSTQMVQCP